MNRLNYEHTLVLDGETFGALPFGNKDSVGAYKYASHPSFKMLMLSYKWDDEPTELIDFARGEKAPKWLIAALLDPRVLKIAHNANFEIITLGVWFGIELDLSQWYCTMVGAAGLGLPLGLEKVAEVLKLPIQKVKRGKELIGLFCGVIKKPKKKYGMRPVNGPDDLPEEWEEFRNYCIADTDVEYLLFRYLMRFKGVLPEHEWRLWELDQEINARGVYIDVPFVQAAISERDKIQASVNEDIANLVDTDKPNSGKVLRDWITEQMGEECKSIKKTELDEMLKSEFTPKEVKELIELRKEASKTSASKYDTIMRMLDDDNRVRGLFQFLGANRTWRWAGRGVQLQNLKKTFNNEKIKDEILAAMQLQNGKDAVLTGIVDLLYTDPLDTISRLIRTSIVAAPDCELVACDFAAIEGRVTAWLAGEDWVLDIFHTHGKLYEATYGKMFNVPMESVGRGRERDIGKVASLALGFGGGAGALITMGALRMGIKEEELEPIKTGYRRTVPRIVRLWDDVKKAAVHAIRNKTTVVLKRKYVSLRFTYERGYLFITLPSGRRLAYFNAEVSDKGELTYWGLDQVKKVWRKDRTYGGKLVENIVQAIARDCLAEAMVKVARKARIILHVHDEIVVEVTRGNGRAALEFMKQIMAITPVWAKGLPLKAEGWVGPFYKKD